MHVKSKVKSWLLGIYHICVFSVDCKMFRSHVPPPPQGHARRRALQCGRPAGPTPAAAAWWPLAVRAAPLPRAPHVHGEAKKRERDESASSGAARVPEVSWA